MVVNAALTSIGLNYFAAVVPKVDEFNKKFVENVVIKNLKELVETNINELRCVWRIKPSIILRHFLSRRLVTVLPSPLQIVKKITHVVPGCPKV
jgi:hypothetical protein